MQLASNNNNYSFRNILIIILLIIVVLGVGYWVFNNYAKNLISGENKVNQQNTNKIESNSKYEKNTLQTSAHTYEKIELSFDKQKDWVVVTKEDHAKYYYDNDIHLFPSIAEKNKEDAYLEKQYSLSINNPSDWQYLKETPGYERTFQRNGRLIAATIYKTPAGKTVETVDLTFDDKSISSRPVFDKILVDNKKVGQNEYHCLQSKKDNKFLINCAAKIGDDFFANISAFTNNDYYNNDLDALYRLIEKIKVTPTGGYSN